MRRILLFGPFRLDLLAHQLWRGSTQISLAPKTLDVLVYLAERAGEVVSRESLFAALWPDTFVDDHALSVQIRDLRKALGDDPKEPQFIVTRHRRGYFFKASVQKVTEPEFSPEPAVAPTTSVGSADLSATRSARTIPETHYVRSGDLNIAYQVTGNGPVDLIFVMGWVSHLEYFWTEPRFAQFLHRLSSFSRLILFDKRGTGLSDRVPLDQLPTLEQRMQDLQAVMAAAGSRHAVICGISEGGCMSAVFAATYPEKTLGLIMIGSYARRQRAPDYPWAPSREERERFQDMIREHWGGPVGIEARVPSLANDPEFRDWWAAYLRNGASPGAALALTKMNTEVDIRAVLPLVSVPTLVLHRTGDTCLKVEEGRYVAEHIPGARFVELPGDDHLPFAGDQDQVVAEIERFLSEMQSGLEYDRTLATVVAASFVPDLASGSPRPPVDDLVRTHLGRFRATLSQQFATGAVATFDGPARAIRYACRLQRDLQRLHFQVRIGVHTGECISGGDSFHGAAVAVAMAIQQRAHPGEVLVSGTVRDLVAGSGLLFHPAGRLEAAGLGEWQLLRAQAEEMTAAGQV